MLGENASLFSADNAGGEWVTAYCDGGSRGNPGPAGYGVFIEGADGNKLAELSEFLGKATNNVAEYSALLAALEGALHHEHLRLRVVADSELLVKQMRGEYRVKNAGLQQLFGQARELLKPFKSVRFRHVPREQNKQADKLVNQALNAAGDVLQ